MRIMKNSLFAVVGAAAAVLASLNSCDMFEIGCGDDMSSASVEVRVSDVQHLETRSSVFDTEEFEGAMRNMVLFQFSPDETLYRSYYFPTLDGRLAVQGRSGVTYHFLGLMNMGDVTGLFPVGTDRFDVEQYAYYCDSQPDLSSGCPMSCLGSSMTMTSKGGVLSLLFTRLVARYDFRLDCSSLRHGVFEVTSLTLRQAPSMVMPFLPPSIVIDTSDISDGDYAIASDLNALKSGKAVPFYVLENSQGTLLEGNTDPWAKIPSQLGDIGDACTYVELKGTYTENGGKLKASHTYRMFLGSDSTTNFDVLRGTRYDLTLTLSDEGVLRASWKAERQILSDSRVLYFSPSAYSVPYGEDRMVNLVGGEGCRFTLSGGLSGAGVCFDASTMTLFQTRKLASDVSGTLSAINWDGTLTASCDVTALRYRERYSIQCYIYYYWNYEEDQSGEVLENSLEEWMYFKAVRENGTEVPCRFKIPGLRGCENYQDQFTVWTDGDSRVYAPVDMPKRQILKDVIVRYPLYVTVNGEEFCPSWDEVTFRQ